MSRERLPSRRLNRSFNFDHVNPDGRRFPYTATIGFYPDGRVGEVFLGSTKAGTDADVAIKDSAIALSLAFQYGCPIEVFAGTFMRRPDGSPEGPLGTLIDLVMQEAGKIASAYPGGEG